MPKSQIPNIGPRAIKTSHAVPVPETGSISDVGQPYNVPRVRGNTPNISHSKNLPMTNNKRAPFKSRTIFDK